MLQSHAIVMIARMMLKDKEHLKEAWQATKTWRRLVSYESEFDRKLSEDQDQLKIDEISTEIDQLKAIINAENDFDLIFGKLP